MSPRGFEPLTFGLRVRRSSQAELWALYKPFYETFTTKDCEYVFAKHTFWHTIFTTTRPTIFTFCHMSHSGFEPEVVELKARCISQVMLVALTPQPGFEPGHQVTLALPALKAGSLPSSDTAAYYFILPLM